MFSIVRFTFYVKLALLFLEKKSPRDNRELFYLRVHCIFPSEIDYPFFRRTLPIAKTIIAGSRNRKAFISTHSEKGAELLTGE